MREILAATAVFLASTASAVEVVRAPYAPDVGTLAVRCGKLIDDRRTVLGILEIAGQQHSVAAVLPDCGERLLGAKKARESR